MKLQLTELVIKEIEKRTPYKVVGTPEEADTSSKATINFADKNIVVENPFNLPRQLNATIKASVRLDPQPAPRTEREAAPVVVSETSTSSRKSARSTTTAFYRTTQNLATQIVDMMEQPW